MIYIFGLFYTDHIGLMTAIMSSTQIANDTKQIKIGCKIKAPCTRPAVVSRQLVYIVGC